METESAKPAMSIVFYDGYCGLCSSTVKFLLRKDRFNHLFFAPLDGKTFNSLVAEKRILFRKNTVIFFQNGTAYYESDASLNILKVLPPPWKYLGILLFIPRSIRNLFYTCIAQNRIRWFGKNESCFVATGIYQMKMLP